MGHWRLREGLTDGASPAAAKVRGENEARALGCAKQLAAELGMADAGDRQAAVDKQERQQQQQPGEDAGAG